MTYRDDPILGAIIDRLHRTQAEFQIAIRKGRLNREAVAALVRAKIGILDTLKRLYQDLDEAYEVEESD